MNLINAFGLLNMINEGGADYQEEYKKYILEHRERVKQFADWLKENLPEIFFDYGVDPNVLDEVIAEHDESKYSEEEFEPYAQKFYKQDEYGKPLEYVPGYDEAWTHHWMNNEHHPEHWNGEDMPYIYILEMLCDWGSFSIAKDDLTELSKYYYEQARDDKEKDLSDNTKIIIEEILEKIDCVLDHSEKLEESLYEKASDIFGTDFLYHATYEPYWKEIQKDGFIFAGKHCNWQDLSKPNLIYLAKTPEIAFDYCETNEEVSEEFLDQIVILQIDINQLDLTLLDIDENILYTYDGDVDPDYPMTWQEFQYRGKIPLNIISVISKDGEY